jgi:hypothetical protein
MKKVISLLGLALLMACSSVKQIRGLLSDGNFDAAIAKSIEELREDKIAKGQQNYIVLLEEAFDKAKQRDHQSIDFLKQERNPANYERIYKLYMGLHERQERVKALLPLRIITPTREAYFPFESYDQAILQSKQQLCGYLYANAKGLMSTKQKPNYRRAFDDLHYLNQLSPNYQDSRRLMEEAHYKGTDFIYFSTKNNTNTIIPANLQEALLAFDTYGLNDQWTVYHATKQNNTVYDLEMTLSFENINISPEKIKEREFIKEKVIVDGKKALLNDKGLPVKDDKGQTVMVDNQRTIRANIYEFTQHKSCQINAKVDVVEIQKQQLLESFPLGSSYVFHHKYATFSGNKHACDDGYGGYFDESRRNFPSNEQMVYNTGKDLKNKLKAILQRKR